jgi:hypothetical protein
MLAAVQPPSERFGNQIFRIQDLRSFTTSCGVKGSLIKPLLTARDQQQIDFTGTGEPTQDYTIDRRIRFLKE